MTIGPKPLEEFSDRECALIEEAAAEGNAHLAVLGDAIAAVLPGQGLCPHGTSWNDCLAFSCHQPEHLMVLDPED